MAVRQAMNTQRPGDAAERWPSAPAQNVARDVAIWRDDHELPLNDRQQQIVDRTKTVEPERAPDRGPDISY